MPPLVSIVGWSGAGKTALMVALVRELKARGYRVATIKHAAHGFDLDQRGKDSWRHYEAGSDAALVAAKDKLALIKRLPGDAPLEELLALLGDGYDLVLAEGYKELPALSRVPLLRLEVHRRQAGQGLLCPLESLTAVITDEPLDVPLPQYRPEDVASLADLLVEQLLGPGSGPRE